MRVTVGGSHSGATKYTRLAGQEGLYCLFSLKTWGWYGPWLANEAVNTSEYRDVTVRRRERPWEGDIHLV